VKITDEYGVTFPTAMVVILKARFNDEWSMEASGVDEEYEENNSIGGGTFEAMYYCSPQARAMGVPLKPLRTYEGGVFSKVMIIDTDRPEIKPLLSGPADRKDKATAIVKKHLELQ